MTTKTIRYEVSDLSDKQTSTLQEAREIAKKWAIRNYKAGQHDRFILIHKFSIPGNPYSNTILVEKWKTNVYGNLIKK